MTKLALLGDEAVALAALHSGISAAYGYPGTPSTEILEYLLAEYEKNGSDGPYVSWCANEKTAMEAGLGVSFAGRRSIITMKHVGLNVASDPFINAALLGIKGGLVIAVADDPGMHSSQNEQDSRFYASFAMIPCLEPRNPEEAYNFTKEAFEVSEHFQVPVLIRLATRLSHARAEVEVGEGEEEKLEQNALSKAKNKEQWMLLPAFARRNYAALIKKQEGLLKWSVLHNANKLEMGGFGKNGESEKYIDASFAIITSGLGGNYYDENLADFVQTLEGKTSAHLHIGAYPLPITSIQKLCEKAEKILVIEEGQPFIEERLRGLLPQKIAIAGKLQGFDGNVPGPIPRFGELDPDNIRKALSLPPRSSMISHIPSLPALPSRPPQLCQGCPHGDSYETIKKAVSGLESVAVTSDIGCYSLGASPPYSVPETIVCMGASIGMAKGASDAGIKHPVAVIGDSTFIHSGITGLIDAVASDTNMTLVILDNSIVAMTGCQETIVPSEKLKPLVLGLGVNPDHLLELDAKRHVLEENAARLRTEIEYSGLSVVIFKRPCLEALRKWKKKEIGSRKEGDR
jgi:indolepyruvate ferredoxin oxidoreductase alpha subunit